MFHGFRKTDGPIKAAPALLIDLAILSVPSSAWAYTFDDVEVTYWTGADPDDGVNEAVMVVDWQIPDKKSMVFGYRWTGDAIGMDMLNAIHQADERFYMEWHPSYPGAALYGIGWDADGDGFSKTDPNDYYAEGWMLGAWRYYLSRDGETWTYSDDAVFERTLADGDWDGWSWAPGFLEVTPPDNLPADLPGDSNGDGVVNGIDYDNLIAQFGGAPGVHNADFNGDNIVNLADFVILREIIESAASPEPGAAAPEPTTMVLMVLGAAGLVARRRGRV